MTFYYHGCISVPAMKTNHTPTPWVQNKIFGKPAFNIQSGQTSIAMVYENIGSNVLNDRDGEGEANAQFIVKAVNHYDELVRIAERLYADLLAFHLVDYVHKKEGRPDPIEPRSMKEAKELLARLNQ